MRLPFRLVETAIAATTITTTIKTQAHSSTLRSAILSSSCFVRTTKPALVSRYPIINNIQRRCVIGTSSSSVPSSSLVSSTSLHSSSNTMDSSSKNNSQVRNVNFPGEYTPHIGCIMIYPHNPYVFRLEPARTQFLDIANAICTIGQEDVYVLCKTSVEYNLLQQKMREYEQHKQQREEVRSTDGDDAKVIPIICPNGDAWARDMAPTFVVDAGDTNNKSTMDGTTSIVIGLDWKFNGYGVAFDWTKECDEIPSKLIPLLNNKDVRSLSSFFYNGKQEQQIRFERRRVTNLVLEGGSIHTDGIGTLITTEECLLNPNRNPNLSKNEIEQILLHELGCSKIIWLPYGVDGDDDTSGHVDNWVCFINDNAELVLCWTDLQDEDPINYERCRQALEILEQSTDALGRTLTIHKLHLPRPIYYTQDIVNDLLQQLMLVADPTNDEYNYEPKDLQDEDDTTSRTADISDSTTMDDFSNSVNDESMSYRVVGERMAGSYINFYIANEAVIVPQFGDPIYDAQAIETLRPLFPTRTVVGIPSKEILVGGGNIHCITQQIPAPVTV